MINYRQNIIDSGLSIYDIIDPHDQEYYIPSSELENMLSNRLIGESLYNLPLRTRSKVVKSLICDALGYPVPKSFLKTQPRFPGQNFDVYTQKSMNVQIWNEVVDIDRRYVFIKVDDEDVISNVRVITGDLLATYDHTGKLTTKYQATMNSFATSHLLSSDTPKLSSWINNHPSPLDNVNPNSSPNPRHLLPIYEIYNRLLPLCGEKINFLNSTQERNRGAELHALICNYLGYSIFEDDGTYPDIANQLLEIKLQTSPTIDLGLHSPEDGASIACVGDVTFTSEDIRYVIFDGYVIGSIICLKKLYVVSGLEFTRFFPLFQGKGKNAKIQLPLPTDFFD